MWWLVALFAVVVVLGVALDRRRRASGTHGPYDGTAPVSPESAAAQHSRHGDTGWGAGGS